MVLKESLRPFDSNVREKQEHRRAEIWVAVRERGWEEAEQRAFWVYRHLGI